MSSTSIPTSAATTRGPTRVEAVFHHHETVARAVERLSEKSVPADSIRVFVSGPSGERRREIAVEDESGALKGALIGAGIGAFAGLLIAIAVGTGMYGPVGTGIFSLGGIVGALRAMLAVGAVGVPIGGLLGMGYWQGRKKIAKDDFEEGTAVVVVESDELCQLARETLDASGASEVTVE